MQADQQTTIHEPELEAIVFIYVGGEAEVQEFSRDHWRRMKTHSWFYFVVL